MKIRQLSLFLENRPGSLNEVCRVLRNNNINISTLSLADTENYGILRLLIKDYIEAKKILENAGFMVDVTEVLALPVSDHPGGLAALLDIIDAGGINIEYMYAFSYGKGDKAIMVFRFEDPERALRLFTAEHIDIVKDIDLFK